VSCPRTQRNVPGQHLKPGPLNIEASTLTMRPPVRFPLANPKGSDFSKVMAFKSSNLNYDLNFQGKIWQFNNIEE